MGVMREEAKMKLMDELMVMTMKRRNRKKKDTLAVEADTFVFRPLMCVQRDETAATSQTTILLDWFLKLATNHSTTFTAHPGGGSRGPTADP